jgi:hypothetical protein
VVYIFLAIAFLVFSLWRGRMALGAMMALPLANEPFTRQINKLIVHGNINRAIKLTNAAKNAPAAISTRKLLTCKSLLQLTESWDTAKEGLSQIATLCHRRETLTFWMTVVSAIVVGATAFLGNPGGWFIGLGIAGVVFLGVTQTLWGGIAKNLTEAIATVRSVYVLLAELRYSAGGRTDG